MFKVSFSTHPIPLVHALMNVKNNFSIVQNKVQTSLVICSFSFTTASFVLVAEVL